MSRKAIILVVVLFALIVLGMFLYAHLKRTEMTAPTSTSTPDQSVEASSTERAYPGITRIDGTHYYIDGEHTVVGEINFPTPCDLLEVDARVAESMPEQITLDFTVINNAETCAQVMTPQRYSVSAEASADATFQATFMGEPIDLNIKPAPEGETPEDFEVFIKG